MSGSTSRVSTRRRTREEIIELFRACAAKLNRTPRKAEFERTCGVLRNREGDLGKLTNALSSSPIRSANLLTASALMRLVEDSIRNRSKFSLGDFERQLFAHKVIET